MTGAGLELTAETKPRLEFLTDKNNTQLSTDALSLLLEGRAQAKPVLPIPSILPEMSLMPSAKRPGPVENNPNLALGNPSNATTDVANADNYLLVKDQYVASYNKDHKTPNWVSWQLDEDWLGSSGRTGGFTPDESLPQEFDRATPGDYKNSGYDRGHNIPSGDRTRSKEDNATTFLMTNMAPQAPDNNQGPWEKLESYSRDLAKQGKELYIVAGSDGSKGTIGNGVNIPEEFWKMIVVLPKKGMGVNDVTADTQIIAVEMPNEQGIRNDDWHKYITTVDSIEKHTGYHFMSNVPKDVEKVLAQKKFVGN